MERDRVKVIRCDDVTKNFITDKKTEHKVIGGISFDVYENEFVALFGPGQCGKTTLVNILSGLEPPTTGAVYLEDKPITGPGPDRGVVYQSISLFPWFTVMENVEYGLKCRNVGKKERREKAQHYINLVGLQGFEKAYPVKLSGGMKQRVGIARIYCNDPKVLFMDEPFGALDAQTRYMMEEEVVRVWRTDKRTVVFVTNNIEEALYLAERIVLMTNCPSRIKKEFKVDLPRPRDYTSPEFLELRRIITHEMDKTL